MKTAVLIEKNGNIKNISLKSFSKEEICKKAGFKSMNGFDCHHIWKLNDNTSIQLYGKQIGRANQENKYEFPPPVDNILFFGSCVLSHKNALDVTIDLSVNDWEDYYIKLYGGFEDIQNEEDLSSNEEINDKQQLTTTGYVKDDFVVEDSDEEDEISLSSSTNEKKQNNIKKKTPKLDEDLYLDCTSELSEEEYI